MNKVIGAGAHPAIFVLSILPFSAQAGGLGTGLSDAEVRNERATAGVYCPALEATITESLAAQIDCDDGTAAQPAVADDRIENRRGLFGILPASGPIRDFDDRIDNEGNDDPEVARNDPAPAPQDAAPEPAPEPEPEPEEAPPPMNNNMNMHGGD